MTNSVCMIRYSTGRSASAIFGFTPLFNNVSCDAKFSYSHAPEQNQTRIFGNLLSLIKSEKDTDNHTSLSVSSKGNSTYKNEFNLWFKKYSNNLYSSDLCMYLNKPTEDVKHFGDTIKSLSDLDSLITIETISKNFSREDRELFNYDLFKFSSTILDGAYINDYLKSFRLDEDIINRQQYYNFIFRPSIKLDIHSNYKRLKQLDYKAYTIYNLHTKKKYPNPKIRINPSEVNVDLRDKIIKISNIEKELSKRHIKLTENNYHKFLSGDFNHISNDSYTKALQIRNKRMNNIYSYIDIYRHEDSFDIYDMWCNFDVSNKCIEKENNYISIYKDFSKGNMNHDAILGSKDTIKAHINDTVKLISEYSKGVLINDEFKSISSGNNFLNYHNTDLSLKSSFPYLIYDKQIIFVGKDKKEALKYDSFENIQRSITEIDYYKDEVILSRDKTRINKQDELIMANNTNIRRLWKDEYNKLAYSSNKGLNVYSFNHLITKNSPGLFSPAESIFVFNNKTKLNLTDMSRLLSKDYYHTCLFDTDLLLSNNYKNKISINDNILLSNNAFGLNINDGESFLVRDNPFLDINSSMFLSNGDSNIRIDFNNILLQSSNANLDMFGYTFMIDKTSSNKINIENVFQLGSGNSSIYIDNDSYFLHKDISPLYRIDNEMFAKDSGSELSHDETSINLLKDTIRLFVENAPKLLSKYMSNLYTLDTSISLDKEMSNVWYENDILSAFRDESSLSIDNSYVFASFDGKSMYEVEPNDVWLSKSEVCLNKDAQFYKWLDYSSKSICIFNSESASKGRDNLSIEDINIFGYNYNKELDLSESKLINMSKGEHDFNIYDHNLNLSSGGKEVHIDSENMSGFSKDFLPPIDILKGAIDELLLPHGEHNYSEYKDNLLGKNLTVNRKYIKKINEEGNPIINVPIDNPVKYYTQLADEYIDVDVKIMRKVIELLYKNWRENIHRHAGLEATKAMNHILEITHEELKEWYTSVTEPNRIKSAERSLKLFAWYCEMGILTYSDKEVKYKRSNGVLGFWNELPKYSVDDKVSVKAIDISEIDKLENFLYNDSNPFILSSDPGKVAKFYLGNMPQHCDTTLELKAYMLGTGELTITTSDNVYIYRDRVNSINITLPSDNNSFKIEFIPDDITSSLDIANFVIGNRYNDSYELEYDGVVSNVNFTIQYVLDFMTIAGDSIEEVQPVFKTTAQLAYTLEKFREYMEIHHNKKHKGKRLTVRKS